MGLSDVLDRIKEVIGIGGSREQQSERRSPQNTRVGGETGSDGTTVTVEREPSTASEDAVKGTDTASELDSESEEATTTDEGDDDESDRSESDEPTDVIKGIGSTYADRLADAGVETVADLAVKDAETLAEETDISEKRLGTWIERAKHRSR